MGTPYAGADSYPVNVTLPDGSDADDAATAAIPITQLADRTAYCKARIDGVTSTFTDAILHGNTTMPDGTLVANLTAATITSPAIALAGNTTLGSGAGDTVSVNAGALNVGSAQLLADASSAVSLAGTNVLTSTSDTEAAGLLRITGKLRLLTTNHSDANATIDGTNGYEHVFPDNPAAPRAITLSHTGAALGQRVRFNAQNVVTGTNTFVVTYGARSWFMRNASTNTVVLEFVSNGSAWVVDDWQEGGSALRNG